TTIPVDSRPSQPLVPRREEEALYREPAVANMTPYEVMPTEVPIQDIPTADMPTAPTRVPVGEVDAGATDRVPVIDTSEEYDESDTIVVSIPKYAHSTRGTQSSDPTITRQEDKAFDSAAPPAETEVAQEQQTPQEEPVAEMDEPTALAESPASEMGEMDETWVRSYSLLDTDEESVWLQPLPPSQPVEEPTWLQSVTDPHTDVEQPAWLQS